MAPTLDHVMSVLPLIFVLIKSLDPMIYSILKRNEVHSFFAISWIMTWFAHDISNLDFICRIFDFLLSFPPIMSVYLSAIVILQVKPLLLELAQDPEMDAGTIHQFFREAPMV